MRCIRYTQNMLALKWVYLYSQNSTINRAVFVQRKRLIFIQSYISVHTGQFNLNFVHDGSRARFLFRIKHFLRLVSLKSFGQAICVYLTWSNMKRCRLGGRNLHND